MHEHVDKLMDAVEKIWAKIDSNKVVIDKRVIPLNGNLGLLFSDSSIDVADKLILRSYMNVTQHTSGCHALRKRIGQFVVMASARYTGSVLS